MKLLYSPPFTLLFVYISSALFCFGQPAAKPQGLVEANTAFACDLYGRLWQQQGNLLFSPYSISTCLGMAYAGSAGETQKRMAKTLHFYGAPEQVSAAFGQLQRSLADAQKRSGIDLTVANGLWAQKDHPFLPEFLKIGTEAFRGKLTQVDFKQDTMTPCLDINAWVGNATHNRIMNIVSPGSFNEFTRVVLANAVYFKAKWAERFEARSTRPQTFHLTKTHSVSAPSMHSVRMMGYSQTSSYRVGILDYAGHEFAMAVVLPADIDGLPRLEASLNVETLSHLLQSGYYAAAVDLYLPRFTTDCSTDLVGKLGSLGMAPDFEMGADFRGMDGTTNLFLSSVQHRAWAEVKEEGTEAAAATTVAVVTESTVPHDPPPPIVLRIDHPFLFVIFHRTTGTILFLGRIEDPTLKT